MGPGAGREARGVREGRTGVGWRETYRERQEEGREENPQGKASKKGRGHEKRQRENRQGKYVVRGTGSKEKEKQREERESTKEVRSKRSRVKGKEKKGGRQGNARDRKIRVRERGQKGHFSRVRGPQDRERKEEWQGT